MVERDEMDPFIEQIALELRRPVRVDPAFDARVMASLEPAVLPIRGAGSRIPARPWILRPRTFSLTPLTGLAAAAALAGIAVLGVLRVRDAGDAVTVAPGTLSVPLIPASNPVGVAINPVMTAVPFMLTAADAKRVAIVGDFNGWDADKTPLTKILEKDGVWAVSVLLPPGRFEYQFVIDGERRIVDPTALQSARSEFGDANSVVTVNAGGAR
jgi:hypothetical protein